MDRVNSANFQRSYHWAVDTLGRPGNRVSSQPASRALRRCKSFHLGETASESAAHHNSKQSPGRMLRKLRRCPEVRRATVPNKEKVPISEAERRQRHSSSVEPGQTNFMDHRIHIPFENKPKLKDITRKLKKARSHLDEGAMSPASFEKTEAKLEGRFNDLVYTWVEPEQSRSDTAFESPKRKQD